jgi:beta-glucosidase
VHLDFDGLVGKLDLETKVRLISGAGVWTTEAVPEIGLRSMTVSDGPIGVRGGTDTELDPSATFPSSSAMAASWDEDLLHRIGGLLAGEAARKGVDVVLGPTINRPAGHRLRPGRAGARDRRLPQALRGQRRGDRPDDGRQPGG